MSALKSDFLVVLLVSIQSAKKTCQPDEFTCKNGACTKMNWKCDHNDDCGDNSDETDCPPPSSEGKG